MVSTTRRNGYIRPYHSGLSALYRIVDAGLILVSLMTIMFFYGVEWHERYSFVAVTAIASLQLFAEKNDLYQSWRFSRTYEEISSIWLAWAGTIVSLITLTFILKTSADYSRFVIGAWFIVVPLVLGIWRYTLRSVLHELRRKGLNTRSVAIIGANELGYELSKTIISANWMGLVFSGYFDDRELKEDRVSKSTCESLCGDIDSLIHKINLGHIDIVYITFPMRAEPRVNEMLRRLSDTAATVYFVPDFHVFDMLHGRWLSVGNIPVVSINETPHIGLDGWIKRSEDIFVATMALLVFSIPMLIITLVIKLSTKGPIIFKQHRYGIDGQEIEIWKFRTMTVSENGDQVIQAQANDLRITPFGSFLRRTSLDELPQFFNVLKGDMSVVGPRPHAIAHNEEYRKVIKRYMLRHKVKPGITGLAQVNGWRGETDTLEKMENRIRCDLEYIKNWSLLLDIKVIFSTFINGFIHKNAY